MELEKVVLNKCIQFFEELVTAHEDDDFYGKLPRYMIIEYSDARRMTEHFYKKTLKKRWKYIDGDIVEETIEKDPEENEKSGMYFLYAHASFYWDLEKGKAFVGMTFGPRFGRGYSYDIDKKEDDYELINEEIQWVS